MGALTESPAEGVPALLPNQIQSATAIAVAKHLLMLSTS